MQCYIVQIKNITLESIRINQYCMQRKAGIKQLYISLQVMIYLLMNILAEWITLFLNVLKNIRSIKKKLPITDVNNVNMKRNVNKNV